jgi:hypothetical protein
MWPLPGLIIVVVLVGLSAQEVSGQSGPETLRELRTTDAVLLRGKRLVIDQNCPSRLARELLIQAGDIQKDAWGTYDRGHYGVAMKGTKVARARAQEAIKIAERWQFVAKQIRKTAELLDLAQELVTASDSPRAAALLETAVRQFERGKSALREGQIQQAFHLIKNANKLARSVIAMLQEEQADGERAGRELERTDRLIERAGPLIQESGDENALVLFDRGAQTQAKAREQHQNGQYRIAHQMTLKARDLVARALVMVEGPISPRSVEAAIAATDELMARLRTVIMDSHNQQAIDLFLAAGEHQDKAKAALIDERYKLALAQTKIARRLVNKALDLTGGA